MRIPDGAQRHLLPLSELRQLERLRLSAASVSAPALARVSIIVSLGALATVGCLNLQLPLSRRPLVETVIRGESGPKILLIDIQGVIASEPGEASLLWLGRERISEWSGQAVAVLRIHEFCVFAMLVGGLIALILSQKMHRNRNQLVHLPDAPLASSRILRRHRQAGWTAAIGAGLAFLTAATVLVGMYRRAGGH